MKSSSVALSFWKSDSAVSPCLSQSAFSTKAKLHFSVAVSTDEDFAFGAAPLSQFFFDVVVERLAPLVLQCSHGGARCLRRFLPLEWRWRHSRKGVLEHLSNLLAQGMFACTECSLCSLAEGVCPLCKAACCTTPAPPLWVSYTVG